MPNRSALSARIYRITVFAIVAGVLASTSACMHVSQRAWDNGRAMTTSRQYRQVLNGDTSPNSLRKLYYRSNARQMYQRDVPFPAFGHW